MLAGLADGTTCKLRTPAIVVIKQIETYLDKGPGLDGLVTEQDT